MKIDTVDLRGSEPVDFELVDDDDFDTEALEAEFYQNAKQWAESDYAELIEDGFVVAMAPEPVWEGIGDALSTLMFNGLPAGQATAEAPKPRRIRFQLITEAGDMQVQLENTATRYVTDKNQAFCEHLGSITLSLSKYSGKLEHSPAEMMTEMTVFQHGTPQHVAQAALDALLQATADFPASFYASLAPATRCFVCHRKLTDPISQKLGIGPGCAKAVGIEHSEAMSKKVELARLIG